MTRLTLPVLAEGSRRLTSSVSLVLAFSRASTLACRLFTEALKPQEPVSHGPQGEEPPPR